MLATWTRSCLEPNGKDIWGMDRALATLCGFQESTSIFAEVCYCSVKREAAKVF
jgi:hypothetical protein